MHKKSCETCIVIQFIWNIGHQKIKNASQQKVWQCLIVLAKYVFWKMKQYLPKVSSTWQPYLKKYKETNLHTVQSHSNIDFNVKFMQNFMTKWNKTTAIRIKKYLLYVKIESKFFFLTFHYIQQPLNKWANPWHLHQD
jgi:hypothetical protein